MFLFVFNSSFTYTVNKRCSNFVSAMDDSGLCCSLGQYDCVAIPAGSNQFLHSITWWCYKEGTGR